MKQNVDVVIVNCFDTYEHRAILLKEVFESIVKKVCIITSDYKHIFKMKRDDFPVDFDPIHVYPYKKNLSAQRLFSHYRFACEAIKHLTQEYDSVSLVWFFVPPNSLVKEAAKYKKGNSQVKVVFDVIDMWPESMPISKYKNLPPFTEWGRLRNLKLKVADAVVSECDLYKSVLNRFYDKEIYTLYLAHDNNSLESKPNPPQDRISLCYLGSINNIVDISKICRVIANLDKPVDFHIIGDGEKRQELIDAASNVEANVVYHGKVYDRVEKQKIFDSCHAGFNFMKDSVFVGLTMKSIDYFEAGLPILNTIKGDTWKFVDELGIGVNVGDNSVTADQIMALQKSRKEVRSFFDKNFTKGVFREKVLRIISTLNL